MCEVLAINSRKPYLANAYLETFFSHSIDHPHGWGLAWRAGTVPVMIKEPLPARESSQLKELLTKDISSRLIIAHIRNATEGARSWENCHPFVEEDPSGTRWTIAHNGVILNDNLLNGYDSWEQGDTDSERVALYLMDVLDLAAERAGGSLNFAQSFDALLAAVTHLSNGNKLNLVLDDGHVTYAYTNTVDQTLYMRQDDERCIFCTVPLDKKGWQPVERLQLIAAVDGQVVRQATAFGVMFDDQLLKQLTFDRPD